LGGTARAHKEQTVATKTPQQREAEANAEAAEKDKSADTKCDNHPGRKGRNFTGGGSYSINLCDECLGATPWLSEAEPFTE
jgi:hypothetical protein